MIYVYECLRCHGKIRERQGASDHESKIKGAAICPACCRESVNLHWRNEIVNTEAPNALHKPDDSRDGEAMHTALNDARRKALEFRRKATEFAAEAAKWDRVAEQLQGAINTSRGIAKVASRPMTASDRKPHGFWTKEIEDALRDHGKGWGVSGRGPTKRELCAYLTKKHPDSERVIWSAIHAAVHRKRVLYMAPDQLLLPKENAA